MGNSIAEQLIAEVFTELVSILPTVTTAVGRLATSANAAPPRVVAIPLGGSIDPTDQPGRQRFATPTAGSPTPPYAARRIAVRKFNIEWQCHAAPADPSVIDFGPSEVLFLLLVRLINKACHNSVIFSNEEWIDQQEGNDGAMRHGTLIKVTSTVAIPLLDEPWTYHTLTGTPPFVTTATLNDEEEGA